MQISSLCCGLGRIMTGIEIGCKSIDLLQVDRFFSWKKEIFSWWLQNELCICARVARWSIFRWLQNSRTEYLRVARDVMLFRNLVPRGCNPFGQHQGCKTFRSHWPYMRAGSGDEIGCSAEPAPPPLFVRAWIARASFIFITSDLEQD